MIDFINTDLNVGDIVIFAYGGKSDDDLYQGTVVSFFEKYDKHYVKIYNSKTNRTIDRLPNKVLSIMPIKKVYPENFI